MGKIAPVRTEIFEKFLVYIGCVLDTRLHQVKRKGGHKKYNRSDLARPIIVQAKPEVPVFIIKSNLRTLGLSNDDYLSILDRVR